MDQNVDQQKGKRLRFPMLWQSS